MGIWRPGRLAVSLSFVAFVLLSRYASGTPVSLFSATPNPAAPGQTIAFDGSASYDTNPSLQIVTYRWDFGDATAAVYGVSANHYYTSFGYFVATLIVYNDASPSQSNANTLSIAVTQGNHAPIADAGGPYLLPVGSALELNGAGSMDCDASCGDSIVQYEWDVGVNGQYDFFGVTPTVPWAQLVSLVGHPLNVSDQVALRLRVTDQFGATGIDNTVVNIVAESPEPVPESVSFVLFGTGVVIVSGFVARKRMQRQ